MISLLLMIPVLVFASFVVASQIVLRLWIVHQAKALLVGMGGVPLALAILSFAGYYLVYPANSELPILSATCGVAGGMIGGWVGASVAYITNQARSRNPETERAHRNIFAKAQRQPRRKTIDDRLRRNRGLPPPATDDADDDIL